MKRERIWRIGGATRWSEIELLQKSLPSAWQMNFVFRCIGAAGSNGTIFYYLLNIGYCQRQNLIVERKFKHF
jgi:hypothetical protein